MICCPTVNPLVPPPLLIVIRLPVVDVWLIAPVTPGAVGYTTLSDTSLTPPVVVTLSLANWLISAVNCADPGKLNVNVPVAMLLEVPRIGLVVEP